MFISDVYYSSTLCQHPVPKLTQTRLYAACTLRGWLWSSVLGEFHLVTLISIDRSYAHTSLFCVSAADPSLPHRSELSSILKAALASNRFSPPTSWKTSLISAKRPCQLQNKTTTPWSSWDDGFRGSSVSLQCCDQGVDFLNKLMKGMRDNFVSAHPSRPN